MALTRVIATLACAAVLVSACASASTKHAGSLSRQSTTVPRDPTSSSQTSAAAPSPPFLGINWRLVHLKTASLSFDVRPRDPQDPPRIQLTSDGQFLASDGLNALSGPFSVTSSGFDPGPTASTLAGYAGKDPKQIAILSAFSALLHEKPVTVSMGGTPNTITMSVPGYTLTFIHDGAAKTFPAEPSGSGTS